MFRRPKHSTIGVVAPEEEEEDKHEIHDFQKLNFYVFILGLFNGL